MITAPDYGGNSLSAAKANNQREPARGFTTFPRWPATSPIGGRHLAFERGPRQGGNGGGVAESFPRIFRLDQMQYLQKDI